MPPTLRGGAKGGTSAQDSSMVADGEAQPDNNVMETNTEKPLRDDSDSDGDDSRKKSQDLLRKIH